MTLVGWAIGHSIKVVLSRPRKSSGRCNGKNFLASITEFSYTFHLGLRCGRLGYLSPESGRKKNVFYSRLHV